MSSPLPPGSSPPAPDAGAPGAPPDPAAPDAAPRPHGRRALLIGAGLLLTAAVAVALTRGDGPALDAEEQAQQEAADRAAYAAYLRQAPVPLEGGLAEGALEESDAEASDGRREDYFAFTADTDSAFALVATSDDFAPDLLVVTPAGERVAASALRQTDRRAEVAGLRGRGRYHVTVTSRARGAVGAYELTAESGRAPVALEADAEPHEATLGRGGLRAGRFEDTYALEAEGGEPLIVTIASSAFEPHLVLLGPEGDVTPRAVLERRRSDDGAEAVTVARFVPGWTAPYTLIATSAAPTARGAYSLRVQTHRQFWAITPGQPASRTLGERSWLREGRYLDAFRFGAEAGDSVVVTLRASRFAPTLVLKQGDRVLARGARAEGGLRLGYRMRNAGGLEVEVSSAEEGESGPYQLLVEAAGGRPPESEIKSEVSGPDGAASRAVSVKRSGETASGERFEIDVASVQVTPASQGRARVELDVGVRSVNYAGPWAPWRRFVSQCYLVDDQGRRYTPAPAEGRAGGGAVVAPGEARRGRAVFYGPAAPGEVKRLTLHAPLSREGPVLTIPFDVR